MARVKATTTDIYAKLARGECANFMSGCCQGRTPCTVVNGAPCDYFATYVQPLLDHTDFAGKYAREAKITVALNPRAKVVRKRGEPSLGLNASAEPKKIGAPRPPTGNGLLPAATAPDKGLLPAAKVAPKAARKDPPAVTTRVTIAGTVHTRPLAPAPQQTSAAKQPTLQQSELFLELTPTTTRDTGAKKGKTGKRSGR